MSDVGFFMSSEPSTAITNTQHFTSSAGEGHIAIGYASDGIDQWDSFLVRMDAKFGSWQNPSCWTDNVPIQVQNSDGLLSQAPAVVQEYSPIESVVAINMLSSTTFPLVHNDSLCLPNQFTTTVESDRRLKPNQFIAYPNPFIDVITLKCGGQQLSGRLEIYNSDGIRVNDMNLTSSQEVTLNLKQLACGVYYILLFD